MQAKCSLQSARTIRCPQLPKSAAIEAVSYTHLDVYKRQFQNNVGFPINRVEKIGYIQKLLEQEKTELPSEEKKMCIRDSYGTSLSGLPVDEYAVTDKNGLAKFENVLISGDTLRKYSCFFKCVIHNYTFSLPSLSSIVMSASSNEN